ncbi:Hypothetical predicted protein [Octopus vulgaris]|uniref:Uncharacterized protein n=1 Tax=Octopus vulgaris TaxID=6645 RepID=A0AA36B1I8_OCTVU|nr:Hypothetical predicted protein [Octopus vulgaris]
MEALLLLLEASLAEPMLGAFARATAADVVANIVGVSTAATISPASVDIGSSATLNIREAVGRAGVEGNVPVANVSDGAIKGAVGAAVVDITKVVHCGGCGSVEGSVVGSVIISTATIVSASSIGRVCSNIGLIHDSFGFAVALYQVTAVNRA